MSDPKQQLSELFGLVNLSADLEPVPPEKEGKDAEESAKFGRKALQSGQIDLAIAHFERSVEQGASTARIDLAAALEAAGRDDEAKALYEALLSENADFADGHFGLSEVFKRSARLTEALDHIHRAIAKEPSNAYYHFKLSEMLREQRLYVDATVAAERAALTDPENAFYHFFLGDLMIERRAFEESLEAFRHAVELSPGDDHYYFRTAVAFFGAKKMVEAQKALTLAQELAPGNKIYPALAAEFKRLNGEKVEIPELDSYDTDRIQRVLAELEIQPI